jgi:CMP-N,N'-diacetyllegionaminic acid synthase
MLNIATSLNATAHKWVAHLSSDSAQASEVIENTLTSFSGFQTIVYLQPTSPPRRSSHVIEALRIFDSDIRAPVVSVVEVSQPPEWMYTVNLDGRMIPYIPSEELRRQDTKRKFIPNGAIYISGIDTLREESYVFLDQTQDHIDIDDRFDFELVEWILQTTIQ